MSISKFQDRFLNEKGCGTIVVIFFAFIFLFFGLQCPRNGQQNGGPDSDVAEVAKVGDVPVTTTEISTAVDQANQRYPATSYQMMAQAEQQALSQILSRAAVQTIAHKDNVAFTDDALMRASKDPIEQEIEQSKMQLMMNKMVKPGASPKEIDAAFKKMTGKTPDEYKASMADQIKKALADKTKRPLVEADFAPMVLEQTLEPKFMPSDSVLKSSYDTYVLKRIYILSKPGVNVAAKALEAQNALKGGMSFEDAMNKFSNDPPSPGKKVSDNTLPMPFSQMSELPEYKALIDQKPGYVSPIVDTAGGKAIYKVASIRSDAPKDFATNKAKYASDYAKMHANEEITKQQQALLQSSAVQWTSKGYKALADFSAAMMAPGDQAGRLAAMQKVIDEAKAAKSSDAGVDIAPATYAWYLAMDNLYNQPGADKAAMRDKRIEMLNAVLQGNEDFAIRMELVDLYLQKKDGTDALIQLVSAAQNNTTPDADGQRKFGDINQKRGALLTSGLVKAADLSKLDDAQNAWRKTKTDADAEAAAEKVQEQAAQKKDAELEKQNAAEIAKQKAEAAKAPATGKPGAASGATAPQLTGSGPAASGAGTSGSGGTKPAASGSTTPTPPAKPKFPTKP